MGSSSKPQEDWKRAAIFGGVAYFILFATAVSVLEILSRLIVVPAFDGAPDVDIQELILIATCWLAGLGAANANSVPPRAAPRLAMGVTGCVLLVIAEAYVSTALENKAPSAFAYGFTTVNGVLRLMGYAAFGLVPLLQVWVRLPNENGSGANSVSR